MSTKITDDPSGEYYLQGVPELASGFKVDPGHGFQFFLTYGALDRYGSGKWETGENDIVFQSRRWDGKDFALVESKKTGDDKTITIRITDKNENILRFVAASIRKGEQGSWQPADGKGIIRFPKQEWSIIALVSEFSAERVSVFNSLDVSHNYFEFRFEPWIMEYFFNDFRLTVTSDGLKGKHPMLQGNGYFYKKRVNKL